MKRLIADEQLKLFNSHFKSLKGFFKEFNEETIITKIDALVLKHIFDNDVLDTIERVFSEKLKVKNNKILYECCNNKKTLAKIINWKVIWEELYKDLNVEQEIQGDFTNDLKKLWVNKSSFVEEYGASIINDMSDIFVDNLKLELFVNNSSDVFTILAKKKVKFADVIENIFDKMIKTIDNKQIIQDYYKNFKNEFILVDNEVKLCSPNNLTSKHNEFIKSLFDKNYNLFEDLLNEKMFKLYQMTVTNKQNIAKDIFDIIFGGTQKFLVDILNKDLLEQLECMPLNNFIDKKKVKTLISEIFDLRNLQDNIGDINKIGDYVDLNTRDRPIVYLDGDIIFGDKESSHIQTINKYKEKLKEQFYRKDAMKELKEKFTDIAFGHYGGNVALLENYTEGNVNKEDFARRLKQQTQYPVDKVYEYNKNNSTIKRLAKGY